MQTTFEQAKAAAIAELKVPSDAKFVYDWVMPEWIRRGKPGGEKEHVPIIQLRKASGWLAGYSEKLNTLILMRESQMIDWRSACLSACGHAQADACLPAGRHADRRED